MPPQTDYIRHAAKLARSRQLEQSLEPGKGGDDVDFYRILAKALDQIAEGLEGVARRE